MTRTRLAWLVLVLVTLGCALAYGLRDTGPPPAVADDLRPLQQRAALSDCPTGVSPELPDLELPCLGGGPAVRLRGPGPGVPTLVNVYGSWCGPCFDEMPLIAQLYARAGGRVAVLGVDTEDDPRKALEFAIDVGQRWPSVVDEDGLVSRAYGGGAPKMIFVDAAGRIRQVERKAYRTLVALRRDVERYLGVSV